MRVTAVVVNWNGGDDNLACLDSLRAQSVPPAEIVFVDNGSSDGSPERVAERFPEVEIVRNDRNLGFGGASNQGIALGLERGAETSVSTANGVTTAYLTRLDQLAIGDIELHDVRASIIPRMGVDEILLGMNVLKRFELIQRGDRLIIRDYR